MRGSANSSKRHWRQVRIYRAATPFVGPAQLLAATAGAMAATVESANSAEIVTVSEAAKEAGEAQGIWQRQQGHQGQIASQAMRGAEPAKSLAKRAAAQ